MISDILGSLVVWHVLVTIFSWIEELCGVDNEPHNFTFLKEKQNILISWVTSFLYKVIKWHVVTLLDTVSWAALWLMLYLFGRDTKQKQQLEEVTAISMKSRNLEGYCQAQAQGVTEEEHQGDIFEGKTFLRAIDSHKP